jgi:hypothetical protein
LNAKVIDNKVVLAKLGVLANLGGEFGGKISHLTWQNV